MITQQSAREDFLCIVDNAFIDGTISEDCYLALITLANEMDFMSNNYGLMKLYDTVITVNLASQA